MTQEHHLLEAEFEHSAVPRSHRKSFISVALVWLGFPMIITGAITGAALVHGLGFQRGLLAMILGNLVMFAYVGLLSARGAQTGLNFALLASLTFGRKGYSLAAGLLSSILVGWYAVQTGLTGVSMHEAFGSNVFVATLIAGILYMGITIIGIRALSVIGAISAPLFVILGLYAVNIVLRGHAHSVWNYAGIPGQHISFGLALTIVIALFADAGTMTADFTRWAQNRKHAVGATFAAFPLANLTAMIIGGVLVAAMPQNPGNVFSTIAQQGGIWIAIAVAFLFINLGSVCSHCLYNASVGWSHIVGRNMNMRVMAVILGAVGITGAVLGIWNYFIDWLNILGVLVPPIGSIIILDQYLFMNHKTADTTLESFRVRPFIAWAVGSLVALIVNFQAPGLSTVLTGMVTSGVTYLLISQMAMRNVPIASTTRPEDL
ncbi:hypothetical protein TPY_2014 [Sulfobacillus acidophilus TPY]|nr:hypothetical protein TPY_2014 [Sulfobacillus acidophilus TPY]